MACKGVGFSYQLSISSRKTKDWANSSCYDVWPQKQSRGVTTIITTQLKHICMLQSDLALHGSVPLNLLPKSKWQLKNQLDWSSRQVCYNRTNKWNIKAQSAHPPSPVPPTTHLFCQKTKPSISWELLSLPLLSSAYPNWSSPQSPTFTSPLVCANLMHQLFAFHVTYNHFNWSNCFCY